MRIINGSNTTAVRSCDRINKNMRRISFFSRSSNRKKNKKCEKKYYQKMFFTFIGGIALLLLGLCRYQSLFFPYLQLAYVNTEFLFLYRRRQSLTDRYNVNMFSIYFNKYSFNSPVSKTRHFLEERRVPALRQKKLYSRVKI